MLTPKQAKNFQSKVQHSEGCWTWKGEIARNGYGRFWMNNERVLAHRLAYEAANGPIPKGLTIDHLCRNRSCVRPSHLEAVTMQENLLRGVGLAAENARKTHCIRGHLLVPVDKQKSNGAKRRCLQCYREAYQRSNALRAKRRAGGRK